jgi:hypothetical protein
MESHLARKNSHETLKKSRQSDDNKAIEHYATANDYLFFGHAQ